MKVTSAEVVATYGTTEPKKMGLTRREFAYFINVHAIAAKTNDYGPNSDKALSLKKSLDIIDSLYHYIDPNGVGKVDCETMYKLFNNIKEFKDKSKGRVGSSWVNDFCLKTLEIETATLNRKDFAYGILMGEMERIYP